MGQISIISPVSKFLLAKTPLPLFLVVLISTRGGSIKAKFSRILSGSLEVFFKVYESEVFADIVFPDRLSSLR